MAIVAIHIEFDTDEDEVSPEKLTNTLDAIGSVAPQHAIFGLWVDGEQRDPDEPGEPLW